MAERKALGLQTEKWVRVKVDPAELKELMQRQDARPFRDFALYFGLLAVFTAATIALWGSWRAACRCWPTAFSVPQAPNRASMKQDMALPSGPNG